MKPYQIKKQIELLEKQYQDSLSKLANKVLDERIIPYCKENRLSFNMVNGVPRLINENNEYVNLPKFIQNLQEISDEVGDLLIWKLTKSYKFSDVVNYDLADRKFHDAKYENRPLIYSIFC